MFGIEGIPVLENEFGEYKGSLNMVLRNIINQIDNTL